MQLEMWPTAMMVMHYDKLKALLNDSSLEVTITALAKSHAPIPVRVELPVSNLFGFVSSVTAGATAAALNNVGRHVWQNPTSVIRSPSGSQSGATGYQQIFDDALTSSSAGFLVGSPIMRVIDEAGNLIEM